MPAPTAKDEWITEFMRYVDEHTDRGSGKYAKLLAEQAWRDSAGKLTGQQAAMRWVADHEPKAHEAPRRRTKKDG